MRSKAQGGVALDRRDNMGMAAGKACSCASWSLRRYPFDSFPCL